MIDQELTALSARDMVNAIEAEMKKQPQIELPVRHFFSTGVYAREIFVPAGTMLTGRIHKFQQINILSKGRMRVLIGNKIEEIEASFTVVSPPGTKRIGFAVSDCVWTTFLPTDEIDTQKIQEQFTADSEEEYQAYLLDCAERQKWLS